jgi:type IV pilus assembly protein PilM
MAVKSSAVWAIDIGSNSLKALHLSAVGDVVDVIGFDHIQHEMVVTGSGVTAAERDELVALSFRQFVEQNNLGKDTVVVSVPSQNSFARFVNLPPVDQKRIPEIVQFEAVQQIPFDINDVQWDWQLMTEEDSPEKKVGIFAIKNEVVNSALEHFSRENVQVSYVQMAPMALYNYVLYDRADLVRSDDEAVVILNIGADNTDLVVCTASTVWQRCILIGGNAFTRAIADTFKLNFEKAEKLKRTAPMSKYARQIFQAMRPVFTDLATEIQRSLGFYRTSHPNTKLSRIIALGGGTKLRGLLKYLQQTVEIPVERPDSFKRLEISSSVSAAKFHENVNDFGIVYGLGLQGLGLSRIESNLLPRSIARSMAWASKARYFIAAASLILLVSVLSFARTLFDKATYGEKEDVRQETSEILSAAGQAKSRVDAEKKAGSGYEAMIQKKFEVFKYRGVIPQLVEGIISALPDEKNNPAQSQLYRAFAAGDVEKVLEIEPERSERKQIFITSLDVYFVEDINATKLESRARDYRELYERSRSMQQYVGVGGRRGTASLKPGRPGFIVTIVGYSPYDHRRIYELMDPAGVEDNQAKWGFITRLAHLDAIVDGNCPFELHEKTNAKHFKLEIGEVEARQTRGGAEAVDLFKGIGVEEIRYEQSRVPGMRTMVPDMARVRTTIPGIAGAGGPELNAVTVLVDPMTKEVISKVAVLDENGRIKLDSGGKPIYKVNDSWFILNAKFAWKDAPKPPVVASAFVSTTDRESRTPAVPISKPPSQPSKVQRPAEKRISKYEDL